MIKGFRVDYESRVGICRVARALANDKAEIFEIFENRGKVKYIQEVNINSIPITELSAGDLCRLINSVKEENINV